MEHSGHGGPGRRLDHQAARPAAEIAALAWTSGAGRCRPLLAPAVRDQVIPWLRRTGKLPPPPAAG